MDITHDDVINILRIIDQSSYEELCLEVGDFKLIIRKKGAGISAGPSSAFASVAGVHTAAPPVGEAQQSILQGARESAAAERADRVPSILETGCVLKAPMVGIFYRAPAPGAPPFVDVGSLVTGDETVCIIEVMKLMHSMKAGFKGRVAQILAENGMLVEYGQPLIVIEPLS